MNKGVKEHDGWFKMWLLAVSLAPLFGVAVLLSIIHLVQALSRCGSGCGKLEVALHAITLVVCCVIVILTIFGSIHFERRRRRRPGPGIHEVVDAAECEEQALTFFFAIVVPVCSLAVSSEVSATVCFWALVVIMIPLLLRTGACFWNPVLVMWGFKLYEAALANEEGRFRLITRDDISIGSKISLIRVYGRYFFVSKIWEGIDA